MNRYALIMRHLWLNDAPLTLDFLEGLDEGIEFSVRLLANARRNVGGDRSDSMGRSTISQVYLPHASMALLICEIAGSLEVYDDQNPIFHGTGRALAPRAIEAWATGKLRGKYAPLTKL